MFANLLTILLSPLAPWMPTAESDFAHEIDLLYAFIFWLSVFFFLLIVALMGWFMYKYQRGEKVVMTPRITHNLALELTWSGIPALLIIIIAFWGFNKFIVAGIAPADSFEINVTGKQWSWTFEHPDGTIEGTDLVVPLGKPIKLVMSSTDVIHSFFIPDFRVKADVIPGRYTSIWFTPKKVGDHQVFCTEYCGKDHSAMLAMVHVVTPEAYKEYLETQCIYPPCNTTPEAKGEKLYKSRGCNSCHSVDGTPLVGPSFKGLFGRTEQIVGAGGIAADENYIRESILQPQAKIVVGFEGQAMPAFQGSISDAQIKDIIAYIKSLK